ncbi:hypothetical protein PIB30_049358 [Stylosanthes scabra]|uniref:Tify domain-containing protein n=1 Tax=Stylosanthes scabra TaxID=79078 RepID=A0ABU6SH60_9FABA|nr:hypothetical protein [Stylosanthes scabra]
MENCADSEQFLLRFSIRTGFKREFEFAMKAQFEICWSLSRTRASKHGNVVQVVNRLVKKRSKKSSSTKELKNLHGQSIGKVGALDDGKEPKNDGDVEDGVVGGPTLISVIADSGDSVKGSFVSVEKPFRRFTKSLLKIKLENDATGAKGGYDKGNDDAEAVEVGGNNKKQANDRGKDVKEKIKDGALVTMSKASTKRCPTSLKELLATRILEGLPVNYVHSVKARKAGGTRLPGVISGDEIVCHCEHCHGVEDLRMHKLIFEADVLPDGTKVAYDFCRKRLLDGYKQGFGIVCSCCDKEISPSQFEAHAGWGSRRVFLF